MTVTTRTEVRWVNRQEIPPRDTPLHSFPGIRIAAENHSELHAQTTGPLEMSHTAPQNIVISNNASWAASKWKILRGIEWAQTSAYAPFETTGAAMSPDYNAGMNATKSFFS